MDTQSLYNEKRFSDLTIKLSDGTTVYAHKIVLCRKNEYFNKLCGPESQFTESKQTEIELKDDERTGLVALLRWLYSLPALEMGQESWSEWLNVRLTADKYLDEELSLHAFNRFWIFCKSIKTPEEVFELIKTVEADFSHDRMLVIAMKSLRRTWLHKLLQLSDFAAYISRETMLELLKELSCNKAAKNTADVPDPSRMYITHGPKTHHIVQVCDAHRANVLEDITNRMPHDLGCYACNENDEMGVAGTTCELHTVRLTLHESR